MPHDPKYQFGDDDRVWHRLGGYYLPDDEPMMLLRGKDVLAPAAIRAYIDAMRALATSDPDPEARRIAAEHVETATERLREIERWQAEHADRAGVGCHSCKPAAVPSG